MPIKNNKKPAAALAMFILVLPFFCLGQFDNPNNNESNKASNLEGKLGESSHYTVEGRGCGSTITSGVAGSMTCKAWQRGSQITYKSVDIGTCICGEECLGTPKNYYYYDDPIAKTKQTNTKNITLPVVLAWDHIPGWKDNSNNFLWQFEDVGGQSDANSTAFGAQSYLLEIDNTYGQLKEEASLGGIFRRILHTNQFNATDELFPCFYNSGRVIKWRVRPCCYANGSHCLPEELAPWQTFTTSWAPELKIAKDPDWNGPKGATGITFKGFQVTWCKVFIPTAKQYAKSYRIEVSSDEFGANTAYCHPLQVYNGVCKSDDILEDQQKGEVTYFFPIKGRQDHALFTRNRTYSWRMRTCIDELASNCSSWGQTWKFSTISTPIGSPKVIAPKDDPAGEAAVGLPVELAWEVPDGANSFIYETDFLPGNLKTTWSVAPRINASAEEKSIFDAYNLRPDKQYKWRVRACARFDYTDCDGWSPWFNFRVTGRPPKADSMVAQAGIPTIFTWEGVPGAKSFNFSIRQEGGDTATTTINSSKTDLTKPKFTLGYPDIDQGKIHVWKVQTCAHPDGTVCGEWSEEKTFATVKMAAAQNPNPADGTTIYASDRMQTISWDPVSGAEAYHYSLKLTSLKEADCSIEQIERTIANPRENVALNCLGEYQLAVEPCVDSGCLSRGPKSEWKFTVDQKEPGAKSAFAICGTGYDQPETPWNERETCQIKHTLLLIKIIIDFLMFKLALMILPLLILATGLIYYFQLKSPGTWEKVKSMWRAIGIGYLLMIFAWTITGILLSVAGYPGLWFKIL